MPVAALRGMVPDRADVEAHLRLENPLTNDLVEVLVVDHQFGVAGGGGFSNAKRHAHAAWIGIRGPKETGPRNSVRIRIRFDCARSAYTLCFNRSVFSMAGRPIG